MKSFLSFPNGIRIWICAAVLTATFAAAAATATPTTSNRWQQVPAKDHAHQNPLAHDPKAVQAGALLYRNHCAQCHQANAEGDARHPALRSDRIRSTSDGDIEWFLRQGDLRHGMPSWSSLPQTQRWQIVSFLRSIQ